MTLIPIENKGAEASVLRDECLLSVSSLPLPASLASGLPIALSVVLSESDLTLSHLTALAERISKEPRYSSITMVLAYGHGEIVEAGKALALSLLYKGSLDDLFRKKATPRFAAPYAIWLDGSAQGEEALPQATLRDPDHHYTETIHCRDLMPKGIFASAPARPSMDDAVMLLARYWELKETAKDPFVKAHAELECQRLMGDWESLDFQKEASLFACLSGLSPYRGTLKFLSGILAGKDPSFSLPNATAWIMAKAIKDPGLSSFLNRIGYPIPKDPSPEVMAFLSQKAERKPDLSYTHTSDSQI